MQGISPEANHSQTTENSGDSHVVVKTGDKSLSISFLKIGFSGSDEFSCDFVLQLYPIKLKHHHVGHSVLFSNFWVAPELNGLLRG